MFYRKLIISISTIIIIIPIIILLTFDFLDISSFLLRQIGNINLKKKGILLNYLYVADGLHQEPFIFPFSSSLYKFSKGKVNINAINTYTVGNCDKDISAKIKSVSNFLDPTSKFKDTWFGVYIIFDDSKFKGRKFVLKNPYSLPDDLNNINSESLLKLPELDQMIIVHTTHQGEEGYSLRKLRKEFIFQEKSGSEQKNEIVKDQKGRKWFKVTSEFETISALTDNRATDMKVFWSIKGFVGLPNDTVYDYVDPWHSITIKGSLLVRYFNCDKTNFWAIVYYNGSAYENKKEEYINNWKNTDIEMEFEKMFNSIEIGCINSN